MRALMPLAAEIEMLSMIDSSHLNAVVLPNPGKFDKFL
jgi:hypothetical protein